MTESPRLIKPEEFIEHVPAAATELVQPHLVAIYDETPTQLGTGFLTIWNGKPLLVTAKHVLYGHDFDEEPDSKQIFVGDSLKSVAELAFSPIISDEKMDAAILFIKVITVDQCLPYTCLKFGETIPESLSIMGFLERDFRRSKTESTLRPKPYIFTGKTIPLDNPHIGISHRRRGRTTDTGTAEFAPIPRGLSGTLMVSATGLLRDEVAIFGVFTEERLEEGYVFGSSIDVLLPMMEKLNA